MRSYAPSAPHQAASRPVRGVAGPAMMSEFGRIAAGRAKAATLTAVQRRYTIQAWREQ